MKKRTHNSTYKKLAVQLLYQALCFVSSSVVADSFRRRKRQLLVAAKRWQTFNQTYYLILQQLFLSFCFLQLYLKQLLEPVLPHNLLLRNAHRLHQPLEF